MSKSPIIAEFLMVGELSKYVATDGELQTLEDRFEELILLNKKYSISLQLISKFNTLRLHGSSKVRKYCDDIQTVLALRGNYIDWSAYSSEVNNFRDEWLKVQKGNAYGWEEKVSGDERVMFVLISVLYRNLLDQLSGELHSGKT